MGLRSFVTSDGVRIVYRFDGPADGKVLVLSNSLGTAMAMWDQQVDALCGPFRVLRYDMRGHGRSEAPHGPYAMERLGRDVLELLDALSIEKAVFCGLSVGGMVGQWLGFSAPERIDRLILANTSAYMGPAQAWDARILMVREVGTSAIADAVIERWFTASFVASNPGPVGIIAAMLRASDPQGYASCCAAIRDMDFRSQSALISLPTLVIAGDQDPATPLDQAISLVGAISGATLRILPAAHLSNVEQPVLFTEALLNFARIA